MTHNYWYRCWTPSPRSVADAAALDAGQASCTVTGPTTSRLYAARYAAAASPCGSPAKASSPPSGWAATAGSSRPACPGCCETAASCAATTAKPNISKPSPTSAAPCSAGVASPRPPTEIRPKSCRPITLQLCGSLVCPGQAPTCAVRPSLPATPVANPDPCTTGMGIVFVYG